MKLGASFGEVQFLNLEYKSMKTNQEMVRYIDNFSVIQRTSDGYFDGSELLRQWNNVADNPRRQMSKFLEMDTTKEFLIALAKDESQRANLLIGENQLIASTNDTQRKSVFRLIINEMQYYSRKITVRLR